MLIKRHTRTENNSIFQFLVACGYKRNRVLTDMRKVLSLKQEESLRARDRGTTNRIPPVTTHNPHNTLIVERANRLTDTSPNRRKG